MGSKKRRNPASTAMGANVYKSTIEMPQGSVSYDDSLVLSGEKLEDSQKSFFADLMKSLTTVLSDMYWEMDLSDNLEIIFTITSSGVSASRSGNTITMEVPKDIGSWTQEMANVLGENVYDVFRDDPMYDYEMDEFDIIFELS